MNPENPASEQMTEVLIKSDGTIYVHNLTPAMAVALSALNPDDERISSRIAQPIRDSTTETARTSPL